MRLFLRRRAVPRNGRAVRGFTLMEIIVVVAIIGVAASVVALGWPDGRLRALEREADRLVALLESARLHARASGETLTWRITETGFVFEGRPSQWLQRLPTHWEFDEVVASHEQPLLLGPEPILPPQAVLLGLRNDPQLRVVVATDGLQPFQIQP